VPSPSAEPTVAPRRSSAPVAAVPVATPGGQPSGAPGGVPGGTPGGVPGGQPGGTGAATPIPTPNRAPLFSTPPPTGWDRISFIVTNGVNGEPLQDVCIVLGTGDCAPSRPHTNALGIWYMDLPGDAAIQWEVKFKLDRFTQARTFVTYRPGTDLTIPIKLYQVR